LQIDFELNLQQIIVRRDGVAARRIADNSDRGGGALSTISLGASASSRGQPKLLVIGPAAPSAGLNHPRAVNLGIPLLRSAKAFAGVVFLCRSVKEST
jgi:hypothetical protein